MFNNEGLYLYDIGKESVVGSLCKNFAVDVFNNLIVCSCDKNSLHVFSLDGKYINSFNEGNLSPWSVAAFEDKLLVCDYKNHVIHVL